MPEQLVTASKEGVVLWDFEESAGGGQLRKVCQLGSPNATRYAWRADGAQIAVWSPSEPWVQFLEPRADAPPVAVQLDSPVETVLFSAGHFAAVKTQKQAQNLVVVDCKSLERQVFTVRSGEEFKFGWSGASVLGYLTPAGDLELQDCADAAKRRQVPGPFQTLAVAPAATAGVHIAVFAPFNNGKKASVSIYSVELQRNQNIVPLTSTNLNKALEVELKWNDVGSTLLIKESAEIDASGTSYYGSSRLHHLRAEAGSKLSTVVQKGPVQFCGWSAVRSDVFFVGHEALPCKIEMWNATKDGPRLDLGRERRNYLAVSKPSARGVSYDRSREAARANLVLLGGFGNLPGDVEVWDLSQQKVVGLAKLPWTVEIEFSSDNHYLLSSTTTPRLRVDNCVRVVRCNGEPLLKKEFDELYSASWRPCTEGVSRGLDPAVGIYKASNAGSPGDSGLVLKSKKGFGGALSAALSGTTPTNVVPRQASRPDKRVDPAPRGPPGLPPGMPPPGIPGLPPLSRGPPGLQAAQRQRPAR